MMLPASSKFFNRHSLSRRVMSSIGIFGGTQVIAMLCSLIRIKLVALWIGAAGVGLFGLYNIALEVIASLTQLNMRSSAVRDISAAPQRNRARIYVVVRRWALLLGVCGCIITLTGSPLLSWLTFGDTSHWDSFILLSLVLVILSVAGGELAIMQGAGRLKRLARVSLWGAVGGLAVSVPLFYFFKVDSIVPSIIAYAMSTLVAALIVRERPEKIGVSYDETIKSGLGFLRLGVWMTVSAFVALLAQYLLVVYVNSHGGIAETGYFQAGYTLVNRYVAVLFAAISMEFYPRMAAHVHSRRVTSVYVGHEIAVVLRVLVPAVVLFIVFRHFVVWLFYSPDFYCIEAYLSWAMAGMPFRAVSWCMAYVMIARGDGRTYLFTEITSAVIYLVSSVVLYNSFGLAGAGYAYLLWYILYMCIVGGVYFVKYGMRVGRRLMWVLVLSSTFSVLLALLMDCMA